MLKIPNTGTQARTGTTQLRIRIPITPHYLNILSLSKYFKVKALLSERVAYGF